MVFLFLLQVATQSKCFLPKDRGPTPISFCVTNSFESQASKKEAVSALRRPPSVQDLTKSLAWTCKCKGFVK
jgi:hypothetical protein